MFKRLTILALLSVLIISAKTYSLTISDHVRAGNAELKPGAYSLKLDGSQVVLTDSNGKRIEITAKVETADSKFRLTSITTSTADGPNRIVSIQLAGSTNMIVFE